MRNPLQAYLWLPCLFVLLLVQSCGQKEAPQNAPQALPYPVVEVEGRTVTKYSAFPASIQGVINSEVRAKVAGYIESVHVDEGERVRKGQLLFSLETLTLTQDANAAKARVNVAKVEVEKLKPLVDQDIISPVQLETAKANLAQAQSSYESIIASIGYANIKSPVDGLVGGIPFRKGNLVSPQDAKPLTTVSDIAEVYAYFSMNEKDMLAFRKTIKGNSTQERIKNLPQVILQLADGSEYDHKGTVETITGDINPNTGTVQFRAKFPNPDDILRNGSSGKILLPNTMNDVLVIPQISSFEQQGSRFVYKVQGDTLVTQAIHTDGEINGLLVVKDGVSSGDVILAQGVSKVGPGSKIIPQLTPLDSVMKTFSTIFK